MRSSATGAAGGAGGAANGSDGAADAARPETETRSATDVTAAATVGIRVLRRNRTSTGMRRDGTTVRDDVGVGAETTYGTPVHSGRARPERQRPDGHGPGQGGLSIRATPPSGNPARALSTAGRGAARTLPHACGCAVAAGW